MESGNLRKLGRGIFHGTTLTSWTVPQNIQGSVFMPLGFMEDDQIKELLAAGMVEFCGEWKDHVGGRAINGYPFLGKMRFLTAKEVRILKRWHMFESLSTTFLEEGPRGIYVRFIKTWISNRNRNWRLNELEKRLVSQVGMTREEFHHEVRERLHG